MRRTILATAAAVALLAATASAAAAFPGSKAYGLGVIVHCDAPYGQIVKDAPNGPEHRASGAKAFITTPAIYGHTGKCFQS